MKMDKNEIIDALFVMGTIAFALCAILSTLSADALVAIFLVLLIVTFWCIGPDEE